MIDLAKGYFIDEKPNGCILKKRYPGIRNGVPAECEKIISHHKDTEDAKEAFLNLMRASLSGNELISLQEHLEAVKKANAEAIWAFRKNNMEHFYIPVPKVNKKVNQSGKTIIDFIPFGKECAIRRSALTALCVREGLIEETTRDKDRAMRSLLSTARLDYAVLNNQDAKGYYRPTREDYAELRRHLAQQKSRINSTLATIKIESALCEDFKAGRL